MSTKNLMLGTVFEPPEFTKQLNSMYFDGNGEYTEISSHTPSFTDNWSMAIWVKNLAPSLPSINYLFAWREQNPTGWQWFTVYAAENTNLLYIYYYDSAKVYRQWHSYAVSPNPDPNWYHYVFTWDGQIGGFKLYWDSVLTAPTTTSHDENSSTLNSALDQRIYIGGSAQGAATRWIGPIYSVAIWQTVLDQPQVNAIYNGGNARDIDLQTNWADYQSADYLYDYYRLGIGTIDTDFGEDHGVDGIARNLRSSYYTDADLTSDIPL